MPATRGTGLVDDGTDGLTYTIIGLAMAVHSDLGPGHREETYHNAMTQRFADAGLPAEREPELPIIDEHGNVKALDEDGGIGRKLDEARQRPANTLEFYRFVSGYFTITTDVNVPANWLDHLNLEVAP